MSEDKEIIKKVNELKALGYDVVKLTEKELTENRLLDCYDKLEPKQKRKVLEHVGILLFIEKRYKQYCRDCLQMGLPTTIGR